MRILDKDYKICEEFEKRVAEMHRREGFIPQKDEKMKFAPATNQYGLPEFLSLQFVYFHGMLQEKFETDLCLVQAEIVPPMGISVAEVEGADEPCVAFLWRYDAIKVECIKDELGRDALWNGYRGLIVARSDREHMYDALNKFIDKMQFL